MFEVRYLKNKYPELLEFNDEETILYLERDGKKYIPLEILGVMAGYSEAGNSARRLVSRNKDIFKGYLTKVEMTLVENNIHKTREIICSDLEGARIFMMIARTPSSDKYKKIIANLLNYVPEPISTAVGELPTEIELIARIHKENELIINLLEQHSKEIAEVREIAEKALEGKPLITKKQYWDIYNRIKDLKSKKDKYIWRDVERVFKVSNIGQILQEDYLSVMAFLDEREEELLMSYVRLNQF